MKRILIIIIVLFPTSSFALDSYDVYKTLSNSTVKISIWDNYNNNNVMDKIKTSLQYVLSLKEINKIVLGFQNENELKQVSKLFKYSNCIFPETLYTTDEMLLNPNNWSKL